MNNGQAFKNENRMIGSWGKSDRNMRDFKWQYSL
jgi:hypothetical protein